MLFVDGAVLLTQPSASQLRDPPGLTCGCGGPEEKRSFQGTSNAASMRLAANMATRPDLIAR
jgi:hypothetical protein